jgi:hypothetical protein
MSQRAGTHARELELEGFAICHFAFRMPDPYCYEQKHCQVRGSTAWMISQSHGIGPYRLPPSRVRSGAVSCLPSLPSSVAILSCPQDNGLLSKQECHEVTAIIGDR